MGKWRERQNSFSDFETVWKIKYCHPKVENVSSRSRNHRSIIGVYVWQFEISTKSGGGSGSTPHKQSFRSARAHCSSSWLCCLFKHSSFIYIVIVIVLFRSRIHRSQLLHNLFARKRQLRIQYLLQKSKLHFQLWIYLAWWLRQRKKYTTFYAYQYK